MTAGKKRIIEVSGMVVEESGIGVIQRNLYPKLASRFELIEVSSRVRVGKVGRLAGVLGGLFASSNERSARGHLALVTPLPLTHSNPLVTIVHDLRWLRGAGTLKKLYRRWDLSRVVKKSGALLCVSEATKEDLIREFPSAITKARVVHLGPGIVGNRELWSKGIEGRLLLIGGDKRKRNEFVGEVVRQLPAGLITSVVGVGVSPEAKSIFESVLSPSNCKWVSGISDEELIQEYQNAQYYAHFGLHEGFGLPFVEALHCGVVVVAVNQPLTREILGNSAILVSDDDARSVANQWAEAKIPEESLRREQRSLYSWDKMAAAVFSAFS